jgi:glycosyltransferase involved in cell wall biosynthesis
MGGRVKDGVVSHRHIAEREGSAPRFARSADAPLRVALYSPALPESGASNGVVTYSRIMREALRARGHEVIVVTTENIEHADGRVSPLPRLNRLLAGIKLRAATVRGATSGQAWVLMNVRNAFEAARQAGAQVFEIEESYGWAGALVNRDVAIIERLHGPHSFVRNAVESAAEKRLSDRRIAAEVASLRKVQAVTSPSRGLLDAMTERHGLKLKLASVIPNPMPVACSSAIWRPQEANHDQFLCVGRFDLCKGADIVLRAFAEAVSRRPTLKLIFVGPDNGLAQADGSVIGFDEFVCSEIAPEARARIEFMGPQPQNRIAELRLRSGVALVGSRFESFAYIIAEAMAVGMPILTSDTFGARELIRDRRDGRIVPVGDVGTTAEAIVEMASSPNRLHEFGRSAYLRAGALLAPDRIARETEALYREAVAALV